MTDRDLEPPDDRAPRTDDEEILAAESRAVRTLHTEEERLERIMEEIRGPARLLHGVLGVAIFGSARTPEDHPDYALAREVARRLGHEGLPIVTGGGPGIMEAANRGARDAGALSVGLNIELPFEQAPNAFQDIGVDFHYFFTRKLAFVRYSRAFVVFPGGFGTLDELFEALVLEQTDKIRDFPVVLVGTRFWQGMLDWVQERLVADGMVSAKDPGLMVVTDDPGEVVAAILD